MSVRGFRLHLRNESADAIHIMESEHSQRSRGRSSNSRRKRSGTSPRRSYRSVRNLLCLPNSKRYHRETAEPPKSQLCLQMMTHHECPNEVHDEKEDHHVQETGEASKDGNLRVSRSDVSGLTKRGFIRGNARITLYHLAS